MSENINISDYNNNMDTADGDTTSYATASVSNPFANTNKLLSPLELGKDIDNYKSDTTGFIHDIKFYLFPIVIFIFFIIVLIFFIINPIRNIGAKINKINGLEKTYNDMNKVLVDLQKLSVSQNLDMKFISNIESLVPTNSTKVVEFRNRLNLIAVNSGLTVDTIHVSENLQNKDDNPFISLADSPLFLIDIPAELSATGSLDQFKSFLANLYLSSDFFVVKEMTINKSLSESMWKADFILVKYQFGGKSKLPDNLANYKVGTPLPTVVKFIERKFGSK